MTFGGYDKDMVQSTPFGAAATDKTKQLADAAIAGLKKDDPIFKTPVKDNKGKVVLPDAPYDLYAAPLNQMTYLVEGVVGSTG